MLSEAARELYYHLPDGFRRAVLVRRRSPVWLNAGVLFIHVPRAAGASVNDALYGRFMGHARASDVRHWGSNAVNALPSFAVTRNPWDRLVSAYRFARRGGGIGEATAAVRRARQYRIPAFESFERFVMDWLSSRDVERLDYHFQPQHLYVCDRSGKLLVDHLGRLDDLAPTMEFLRCHLGHVPVFAKANRSGDEVDYRSFYTPELAEMVGRIYTRDVGLFRYRFDPAGA